MKTTRTAFCRTAIALGVAAAYSIPSYAQLEEIIVTATKRVESTQDIPMSIQAFPGEKLDAMGIDNLGDLSATVPNFTVGDTLTVSQITMRGVGQGSLPVNHRPRRGRDSRRTPPHILRSRSARTHRQAGSPHRV